MKISIVGAAGVPNRYGGFEALVENLIKYHNQEALSSHLEVYCSSRSGNPRADRFLTALLRYIPLKPNGVQSIPYDVWGLLAATWRRSNVILLLGVSGAIGLPIVRLVSSVRIVTNLDGIEWRRAKWHGLARWFLEKSEGVAIRWSHVVIADNEAIAQYVRKRYGTEAKVIAYGGDQAIACECSSVNDLKLPSSYALVIARIEPENNIRVILEAFSREHGRSLVVIGNWGASEYGRSLRGQFQKFDNLTLLDPVYDLARLKTVRRNAWLYVHGHSAGGTNPSLVEAMHFGLPIAAFDCDFNRATTGNKALYFGNLDQLRGLLASDTTVVNQVGQAMSSIAQRRYTWKGIGSAYFQLLTSLTAGCVCQKCTQTIVTAERNELPSLS